MRTLYAPILGSPLYQVVLPSLYHPLNPASKSDRRMRGSAGAGVGVGVLVGVGVVVAVGVAVGD